MGDVKLAGVLGLFLGRSVGVAILVAVLAGSVAGVARHGPPWVSRKGARPAFRSGRSWPWVAWWRSWSGLQIVHWYLHAGL